MSMYLPNPELGPTGGELVEFLDPIDVSGFLSVESTAPLEPGDEGGAPGVAQHEEDDR